MVLRHDACRRLPAPPDEQNPDPPRGAEVGVDARHLDGPPDPRGCVDVDAAPDVARPLERGPRTRGYNIDGRDRTTGRS